MERTNLAVALREISDADEAHHSPFRTRAGSTANARRAGTIEDRRAIRAQVPAAAATAPGRSSVESPKTPRLIAFDKRRPTPTPNPTPAARRSPTWAAKKRSTRVRVEPSAFRRPISVRRSATVDVSAIIIARP